VIVRILSSLLVGVVLFVGGSHVAAADTRNVQAVVDAGGQRQWISCSGEGSPTVVISSGLGADHSMWSRVLAPMRQLTRVCVSDRPGLGSSPDRRGTHTNAGKHATELRALLTAVGEKGPFILVAHSYAGLIARAFAASYPRDVAGIMLLDAVYPGIQRTFLPSYHGPWHEGGTVINMAASERATDGGPSLGQKPLIVITAGDPAKATSWADRKWNAEQAKAAKLSMVSKHWFAKHSGHEIQRDQPAIVVAGTRWLLEQARA
jgi:pimeloyl-ACP methyl ester carboxylesterase